MDTEEIIRLAKKAELIKGHIKALRAPKYNPVYMMVPKGDEDTPSMLGIYVYRQDMGDYEDYTNPKIRIPELDEWILGVVSREAMIAELERQLEVLENKIKSEANA